MTHKGLQLEESRPYNAGPPWIFRGRAFYQLHLVKAEVAKRFIPSGLQIVQAFGYTLGGLYLAQYDSSPAGAFDELVIIAGTVWNPPTSCARWAGRVLVNSNEACSHGIKHIGLPSKEATFAHVITPIQKQKSWWQWNPFSKLWPRQGELTIKRPAIHITEMDGSLRRPLCKILFPFDRAQLKVNQWVGPKISMSLPSFSGKTSEQPDLLKYACQLKCSVRAVKPAIITVPSTDEGAEAGSGHFYYKSILAILAAKPVLALCFERMVMHVEAPTILDSNRAQSHPITRKENVTSPVAAAKAL